jgi:predicted type IV restriction endonuclease
VPVKRVVMRDVQSYCGILLDDNNRKPVCRLYFNANQKAIGFFDSDKETRVPLGHMDELYKHADRLKATVTRYDAAKAGTAKVSA